MFKDSSVRRGLLGCASGLALALTMAAPHQAWAVEPVAGSRDGPSGLEARVVQQDQILADQAEQLKRQAEQLRAQSERLDQQEQMLHRIFTDASMAQFRGTGPAPPGEAAAEARPLPAAPVGQAPPQPAVRVETAALPENAGVLTRRGRFIVEPALEYTQTTSNRLVFRGVELVPGINLGAIEASDTVRGVGVVTVAARYGLTSRLEVEARAPYLFRSDRITLVQQRDQTITRELDLKKSAVGDLEFAGRYQLNAVKPGAVPVFVATMRVKTDTGGNPYLVPRDSFGVARALATGSGFWGVEPGISFLFPSDPAVIYGSIGYFHQFARTFDQDVGGVRLGRVSPGDSIGAGLGFGVALNDRFSFSLGYKHNYIFATTTQLGTTEQRSKSLQVGALQFGVSYVLNSRTVLGASFEFGVTADAPNVRMVLRAPISFGR